MKNLKDIVLEKLKVDDIVFDVFPVDGTLDDAVKFLKEYGFEEIKFDLEKHFYYRDVIKDIENREGRYVVVNKDDLEIMFGDTSDEDIDEKNPLYSILYSMDKYFSMIPFQPGGAEMKKYTKKEFAKKMDRYFANK